MKIDDEWKFEDEVSGLRLKVIPGNDLNRLQVNGRDFWFGKDGEFDGTGTCVADEQKLQAQDSPPCSYCGKPNGASLHKCSLTK